MFEKSKLSKFLVSETLLLVLFELVLNIAPIFSKGVLKTASAGLKVIWYPNNIKIRTSVISFNSENLNFLLFDLIVICV